VENKEQKVENRIKKNWAFGCSSFGARLYTLRRIAKSSGQRAENREQRAENREQRAESREQRRADREQKTRTQSAS